MFHAFNFIHVYYYFEFIGNFIHKISSSMWSYSSIYRHLWFLWSIHEQCFVHSISFIVDIYIRFSFIHVVNFLFLATPFSFFLSCFYSFPHHFQLLFFLHSLFFHSSLCPFPPHFSLWTNNNMIFACPLMFPCNSQ